MVCVSTRQTAQRFSTTSRIILDLDSRFPHASSLSLPDAGNANGLDRPSQVSSPEPEELEEMHGHNIQRNTRGHVLEDPALLSLPNGGRPAGGGYASGGGRFDVGATGGGQFHRSLQSRTGSVLRCRDRHPLCAPSALGLVDVS